MQPTGAARVFIAGFGLAINESYDDYPRIVARLNDRWRIIECRDRVQWILQKRTAEARWTGRSYCRTAEALRRCCREERIEIDPRRHSLAIRVADMARDARQDSF